MWHQGFFVVWLFCFLGLVLFCFLMGQGRVFINDLGVILPPMLYPEQFIWMELIGIKIEKLNLVWVAFFLLVHLARCYFFQKWSKSYIAIPHISLWSYCYWLILEENTGLYWKLHFFGTIGAFFNITNNVAEACQENT